MNEERKLHHTYSSLSQSPKLVGVPVMQGLAIFLVGGVGYFVIQSLFGTFVGIAWGCLVLLVYGAIMLIGSQDPMFLTLFLFHLSAKFFNRLVCYENTKRIVDWGRE